MTEPCVIRADYSNWRTVAGRKVLQLVFEVPIEQTADVMARLGVPMPGESRWCAIALLNDEKPLHGGAEKSGNEPGNPLAAMSDGSNGKGSLGDQPPPPKDRKPFSSLPLSQQAALRCGDKQFHAFMSCTSADDAADQVRKLCEVESRADLKPYTDGGYKWQAIEAGYQQWLTTQRYGDSAR